MTDKKQKYIFHVNGLHCKACVLMIESLLHESSHIDSAKVNLKHSSAEVSGDFGDKPQEQIAEELTSLVAAHGYSFSVEKKYRKTDFSDFITAVPIAIAFGFAFVLLQKMGLVNIVDTSSVSYGTAFFIGVIASLSTCMAVVGGLVLSMSATFAKEGDRFRPQMLFHAGRLIAFFIFGGLIGAIGTAFTLNSTATVILSFAIGIVMLILGINLLDVFHFAKKLQPSMPRFISRHAYGIARFDHAVVPFFVGVSTFFLPCGFTQSMQIFTLTSGSFLSGGMIMLSFALGTLPALSMLSFSSLAIEKSKKSGVFFKTAGLIVIMFAIFNLINSLVVAGVIAPVFNF